MPGLAGLRDEDVVHGLSAMDLDDRLKAIRTLKNQIIGNKTKKLSYVRLGAVPLITEILSSDTNTDLMIQATAAIGSFACGAEESIKAVLDQDVVPILLKTFSHSDDKVVEAGARSLKLIFNSELAPRATMFEECALARLLSLLFSENLSVAEVTASMLARCVETKQQQAAVAAAGAIPRLLYLLSLKSPKSQEPALDALAALSENNEEIAGMLVEMTEVVERLCEVAKDGSPWLRLVACSCLANITRPSSGAPTTPRQGKLAVLALQAVIKLLCKQEVAKVHEEAPRVLAKLVANDAAMQKMAGDTVKRLIQILYKLEEKGGMEKGIANTLLALAAVTDQELAQRQLMESSVLHRIVPRLSDPSPALRIAACQCCLTLSRSVKTLRISLVEHSTVDPLLKLLRDDNVKIQEYALATLCNMVLDFSPLKDHVVRCGGLRDIAAFASSPHAELRLNSVWALKNLLFESKPDLKQALMQELPFATLLQLLTEDPQAEVQVQAMHVVRNLVHGRAEDIDAVLAYTGGDILRVIESLLHSNSEPLLPGTGPAPAGAAAEGRQQLGAESSTQICVQALYAASNMATGSEQHKNLIMGTGIPQAAMTWLRGTADVHLTIAALWCLTNLITWQGGPIKSETVGRMLQLRDHNIEGLLLDITSHSSRDVGDRVRTALGLFQKAQPYLSDPMQAEPVPAS